MATFADRSAMMGDVHPSHGELFRSAISALRLFNSNSAGVQTNPTSILANLDGTAGGNHANVQVLPVPSGASRLMVIHRWAGTLSTAPSIRIYGRLPEHTDPGNDVANRCPDFAPYTGASDPEILKKGGAWIPLPKNESTVALNYNPALGSTTVLMVAGSANFGQPSFFDLFGCTHVCGLLTVAAAGMTANSSKLYAAFSF